MDAGAGRCREDAQRARGCRQAESAARKDAGGAGAGGAAGRDGLVGLVRRCGTASSCSVQESSTVGPIRVHGVGSLAAWRGAFRQAAVPRMLPPPLRARMQRRVEERLQPSQHGQGQFWGMLRGWHMPHDAMIGHGVAWPLCESCVHGRSRLAGAWSHHDHDRRGVHATGCSLTAGSARCWHVYTIWT